MDLHGFVRDANGDLGGEQLGHGGFLGDALAPILHPSGAIGEQARGVDLGRHVGQLVLNGLKFGNGPAELFARFGIFERGFVCALRRADGQRGDGNAPAVENPQAIDESFAHFSEHLRIREPAIGEQHLAGGAGAHAQLVFLLADSESRKALFEDEGRDAVMRRGAIRYCHGDAYVGILRVGGECLAAVQHPARAIFYGFGARSARVGAGFRFGQDQQPIHSADASLGMYRRRCSSLAARKI